MDIKKIFIAGTGMMGSGIAQVCAQSGFEVLIFDVNPHKLTESLKTISWSVGKLFEKKKLKEDCNTVLARISAVNDLLSASDADLVIEAVFEKLDVKQNIFRELDNICKDETLISSNTSAISITEIGSTTKRQDRVLGLHFFSPVPMMDAVEVIRGLNTSDETMNLGADFVKKLGKEPIRVEQDIPGFLLNRINMVSYVEAINMVEQGIGTVRDIDKGFKLSLGRKMGPFETGDFVGLDVSCDALMAIYEESRDARYYPPRLLRRMVRSGLLGRKTAKGWYTYDSDGKVVED